MKNQIIPTPQQEFFKKYVCKNVPNFTYTLTKEKKKTISEQTALIYFYVVCLRYYDTADMLIYPNSAGKPNM